MAAEPGPCRLAELQGCPGRPPSITCQAPGGCSLCSYCILTPPSSAGAVRHCSHVTRSLLGVRANDETQLTTGCPPPWGPEPPVWPPIQPSLPVSAPSWGWSAPPYPPGLLRGQRARHTQLPSRGTALPCGLMGTSPFPSTGVPGAAAGPTLPRPWRAPAALRPSAHLPVLARTLGQTAPPLQPVAHP